MSKTIVGKEYEQTKELVTKALEPKIAKLIEKANEHLKKKKIMIGADIQWFFASTEQDKK